jgi:hypothetical protein
MVKKQLLICVFFSPGWKNSPYDLLCQRNSILHVLVQQTQFEMILDAFTYSLSQTTVTSPHVCLAKLLNLKTNRKIYRTLGSYRCIILNTVFFDR